MKNFFYRIFCGFFLGISIFAPGVSGSVMAVMMGIYQPLIEIVSNPLKNLKKNALYLFPMGIGAVFSFVLFIVLFSYLFETFEKATYLVFMGLIAGNIPVVLGQAFKGGFKPHYLIGTAAAFTIALTVGILSADIVKSSGEGIHGSVNLAYYALGAGVTGVASMVPGMSISMLLMLFGMYDRLMAGAKLIITKFSMYDVLLMGIVGVCFLAAMIAFSRLTKYMLHRFPGMAYSMVAGFMGGSLISIFIRLPDDAPNFNWFIGALMLFMGLGISGLFVFLGKQFNKDEKTA